MCAYLRLQLRQWHQFLRQQLAPPLCPGPSSFLCVSINHGHLSLTHSQPQHWWSNLARLIFSSSTPTTAVMNVCVCVCVLLAALSSGSLSLPSQSVLQRAEGYALVSDNVPPPSPNHSRQARSAPAPPSGQLTNYNQPQEDADARNSLSQLLARLISRKASPYQTRSSLTSRASGLAPGHRIKDRDYLGWMDFGRRSAEEYEYSS